MLDDLESDLREGRPVDLLARYAEPMPVFVIADLLGVPREDHVRLRDWSQAIVHMYEQGVGDDVRAAAVQASSEFAAYVRDVVALRRAEPGGVTGGEVSAATALEELIRYDAPLQMFERTATKDVDVAGVTVRAGETVACLMGSANRDPAAFEAADTFDVGRDPNPHVGFGMGLHFCLGAPLARVELEITVRRLLDRFPTIALHGAAPRRPTWVLRGYESLEVTL